jgi:hypothetical protein
MRTAAVAQLNNGVAGLSERLDEGGGIAQEVADLHRRVASLEEAAKSSKKG